MVSIAGGRGRGGGGYKDYREAIAASNVAEIHRRRQNLKEDFWSESSSLPQFWLFRIRLMGIQYSTQFLNSEGGSLYSIQDKSTHTRFCQSLPSFIFAGVFLPSIKEAQAHLAESGDARVLDASLLRSEADLSPEIQLKIITNKIKKHEAEGTSKKKKDSKDPRSFDKSPIIKEGKLTENCDTQQECFSVQRNNECNVTEGTCPFAQVKTACLYLYTYLYLYLYVSVLIVL